MEALCAVQSVHAFLLAPHKLSLDRWAPVDKIFQAASIQPVLIFMNWKHNFLSKQISPKPGKQQGSEAGNERDSQAAWGQKNISKTTIFYCQSMFRTFTWCCEGSQVLWGKFSASPSRTGANKQENRCIIYIVYDKTNCCEFSCLKEPWEASPSNELPLQLPPAFPAPHPFECRRWWAQPSKVWDGNLNQTFVWLKFRWTFSHLASLYLATSDTSPLMPAWKLNRFFVTSSQTTLNWKYYWSFTCEIK